MQDIGFDVISDLNLSPNEKFNWEHKVTSLYCIVAGNISNNLEKVSKVLSHLAKLYQGVFYIPGSLEYEGSANIHGRLTELSLICENIPKVCFLYQQVALINGIAVLGVNGWEDNSEEFTLESVYKTTARYGDVAYLSKSIYKLQQHLDVKHIVVVSNAVPRKELYFGLKSPKHTYEFNLLNEVLVNDVEKKISHWIYGSSSIMADTILDTVNYISNPYNRVSPYWSKRITISL